MHVESVPVASLVLDPANARKHAPKNLEAIKGSLVAFGQQKPIVVTPKGVVLAGNGTLEAARELGWDKIDVVRTQLEGTDATAYAIADNRTGELAEWDAGALSETLRSLQELDFDLGSIGFDEADLEAMVGMPEPETVAPDDEPETAPDAADELPENVEERAKDGQVWRLGAHTLHVGDCLPALRKMAPDSMHALVTDPPAGIAFMGKEWDEDKGGRDAWVAWMTGIMRECLRVLKPGAHGLVWALPRTAHWTATALEDAGFEVRDCVTHLFGTGFPKSLNVGLAIDKMEGAPNRGRATLTVRGQMNNREDRDYSHNGVPYEPTSDAAKQWQGWGTALKPACEFWWLVRKKCNDTATTAEPSTRLTTLGLSEAKDALARAHAELQSASRLVDQLTQSGKAGAGFDAMVTSLSLSLERADTDLSNVWSWSGTSADRCDVARTCITLMESRRTIASKISSYFQSQSTLDGIKPNVEFAWLVRKPLSEKTVAANVLRWGTGGLNIDGCRVATSDNLNGGAYSGADRASLTGDIMKIRGDVGEYVQPTGRFPANLVLDEEAAAALDEQSGERKSSPYDNSKGQTTNFSVGGTPSGRKDVGGYSDTGGASRFFYVAKASKSDRGIGNVHPTVKPVALMEWMLRLVATPAGTVLDPFNGSGTTGLACLRQGFGFTGCEQSPQYADITLARWEMAAGKTASLGAAI